MSVIDWPQEVEGPGVTFKGVKGEAVTCINSISVELETCRSLGDDIGGDGTDLRNSVDTIISSSERSSEWMISRAHEFE